MYKLLRRLKDRTNTLNFATDRIAGWVATHIERSPSPHRILDIGLGSARDLLAVRERCSDLEMYGIEGQPRWVAQARARGIQTEGVDIERESFPGGDQYYDIVLANHVIEHAKELFWLFGEISRVLKPGGIAIIGCPNLASWHNRVALMFGKQPPCMKINGPHIRGITKDGFKQFIKEGGYFSMVTWIGSNLYPFPKLLNVPLSRVFPGLCASIHFVIERTDRPGNFVANLDTDIPGIKDTPFFRGSQQVAAPPVDFTNAQTPVLQHS